MLHSILLLIVLLSLAHYAQNATPQGCTFDNTKAICDFRTWIPPLLDEQFEPPPLEKLSIRNINGTIPSGAFGGLNGPFTKINTYIELHCENGGSTQLYQGIFSTNLHWVMTLRIYNCDLENGLLSRLLENLKSLEHLSINGGDIRGLVATDALAGLTNLQRLYILAPVESGHLPAGFFDGLENLVRIELRNTDLDFIPHNWFKGLVNLERIYLHYNNIQILPPGLFDELMSLEYLDLDNNPWHCSCELRWLLDWAYLTIEDGVVCHTPAFVENVRLENASGLLFCPASSPTILSTTASSAKEITETKISSALHVSTHPVTSMPTITAVASTATAIRTSSSTFLTTEKTEITKWSSTHSSVVSVQPTLSTPTKPVSLSIKSINDVNIIRNIVLISGASSLTVLTLVATVCYKWIKSTGSLNQVDNDEEDRHDRDTQSIDRSSS